jgi:hypothetical protein
MQTYRRSSRQSVFIIEEVSMVGGSKRLLEVRCTVLANFQKTIGEARAVLAANTFQPLTKRNCHGGCHSLAG